jgi:hypothetical protein
MTTLTPEAGAVKRRKAYLDPRRRRAFESGEAQLLNRQRFIDLVASIRRLQTDNRTSANEALLPTGEWAAWEREAVEKLNRKAIFSPPYRSPHPTTDFSCQPLSPFDAFTAQLVRYEQEAASFAQQRLLNSDEFREFLALGRKLLAAICEGGQR